MAVGPADCMLPRPGGTGRILRIDRGAVHDGPGVRSVVFFKGCPLRCPWCHSPETQACHAELLIREERCVACGACAGVCDATHVAGRRVVVDRDRCVVCDRCAALCPTGAREVAGRRCSVDDVMAELVRDGVFYDRSGGGVTLSGGEPLMQPRFALALLQRCRQARMHTAVETCGFVHPAVMREAAAEADMFLFDLKLMDDARHRQATGVSNRRILDNLRALADAGCRVVVRVPLIPGINDDAPNLAAMGGFVAGLGLSRIEVLPYHRAGIAKYARLGRRYALDPVVPPTERAVAAASDTLRRAGLEVGAGGLR
jgi:pyruvate formate lyase activating enzyme